MTFFELVILSVWLSMDVFAVSMSNGLSYTGLDLKKKAVIILVFWLFHFWMLSLWFLAGDLVIQFIARFDHRLALILLLYVWWEMIIDFVKDYKEYKISKWNIQKKDNKFTIKDLFLQALAVSIDAIAVWLSLSATNINILSAATCVGLVSIAFCILWFFIGKKFWLILKHWSQLLWGLILIWIWVKIFLEHMIGM